MCRRRKTSIFILALVTLNLGLVIFVAYNAKNLDGLGITNLNRLSKTDEVYNATLVFREFELFKNDILNAVQSIRVKFPFIPILVIGDHASYPPLPLGKFNVTYFSLQKSLERNYKATSPFPLINTSHVIFVPDSFRLNNPVPLRQLLRSLRTVQNAIIAHPVKFSNSHCYTLKVDVKRWTITMNTPVVKGCGAVEGLHVIVVKKSLLEELAAPFAQPFPHALYVQAAALAYQVNLDLNLNFEVAKNISNDLHYEWKKQQKRAAHIRDFYSDFGIKKVVRDEESQFYGCTKSTPRCFGTIVNDMPDYLYNGKWTPPCCLENLRTTTHHVLDVLEKAQVRYWLEGGSLLGAMRNGEIIPWDYDVDLGVYEDDLKKCQQLRLVMINGRFEDDEQFVWEKANEGDFYRVQFSAVNHLHVDIFPFRSVNGIMTKDTWFLNHKQDMEFPEHFLQPLSKVNFLGRLVSSPNNAREFLELKFGKGAIENEKYPRALDG